MATYKELFINGKRDKARRFYEVGDPTKLISRRKYDTITGKIASRPSSGKHFKPTTSTHKGVSVPKPSKVTQIVPGGTPGGKLKEYKSRVKAYAGTHNMTFAQTRSSKTFQGLNTQTRKKGKDLEKREEKLRASLKDKGFTGQSNFDKLNRNAYIEIASKISDSDTLSPKEKEQLLNEMDKIREQRDELGELYRKIGIKDANDFTAFGDTPEV